MVNPLRVLYVEDDPALRGILTSVLNSRKDIDVVASVGTSDAALAYASRHPIDVALLDLALGPSSISGIELGVKLREEDDNLGIVILSQHQVARFLTRMKRNNRQGWSFILKRADMQPTYLCDVLHSTGRGLNIVDPDMILKDEGDRQQVLSSLTERQHSIMELAVQGLDAPTIGQRLSMSASAVRQDLSRVYQVLVPDPPAGADLRTLAVLQYLRDAREFG